MSTEIAVPEAAPNLFQRLNLVMRDVGVMPKTGKNQTQNYSFIEQSLMMAILRPLFVEHGIVILPEITSTEWNRPEGAKQTTARCQMQFTLANADNPTDTFVCLWQGEGADMGDKGVNKAGTSGLKYFLMKLLMLSDKDDPEADSVPDMGRPLEPRRDASNVVPMRTDATAATSAGPLHWALAVPLCTYLTNKNIAFVELPFHPAPVGTLTTLINDGIAAAVATIDKDSREPVVTPAKDGALSALFGKYRGAGVALALPKPLRKASATWLLALLQSSLKEPTADAGGK